MKIKPVLMKPSEAKIPGESTQVFESSCWEGEDKRSGTRGEIESELVANGRWRFFFSRGATLVAQDWQHEQQLATKRCVRCERTCSPSLTPSRLAIRSCTLYGHV